MGLPAPTKMALDRITVTKLDAAKRQLRTAIELWFADGDPVAIHTLAAAAHEIIHTLFRRKGLSGLMFDSPLIRNEYRADFARRTKAVATFFKHAQRDPEGELTFNPAMNEPLLVFTTYGLHLMGEPSEPPEETLMLWFMVHEPTWFERTNALGNLIQIEAFEAFRNASKRQFFELCKLAFRDRAATHAEIIQAMGETRLPD